MEEAINVPKGSVGRRSFMIMGLVAGVGALGAEVLNHDFLLTAQDPVCQPRKGEFSKGDAAILRFLCAIETIETDLWQQYNELGGVQDEEVMGGSGNPRYTAALKRFDKNADQYIHDSTIDEVSHLALINTHLASKGADRVDLEEFRTLPSSRATGARQIGRLTNLTQLTLDTSWYAKYRSRALSFDHSDILPHAVPSLSRGTFPAIPRSDKDLAPDLHIKAIANTAAFHLGFIEQSETNLYPSLARSVEDPEVLRALLRIGTVEMAHFQSWHDNVGNACPLRDPTNPILVFPDLNVHPFGGVDFQTNSTMPQKCFPLGRKFPLTSIIRPAKLKSAATSTWQAWASSGLFIGQSPHLLDLMATLAVDADAASMDR